MTVIMMCTMGSSRTRDVTLAMPLKMSGRKIHSGMNPISIKDSNFQANIKTYSARSATRKAK